MIPLSERDEETEKPRNEEVEKLGNRETEETEKLGGGLAEEGGEGVEIPPEWAEIDFEAYFRRGFKPYIMTKQDGRKYILLKRGRFAKSLGPYDERRWELLNTAARAMGVVDREKEEMGEERGEEKGRRITGSSLLSVSVSKPPQLSKSIVLSPETLMYYTWIVEKGYDGTLSDFLNECVKAYFLSKGIEPVMYREVEYG